MYTFLAPVPIKSSASLLYNNFDVLLSTDDSEVLFAVVHKSIVWVFNPKKVNELKNTGNSNLAYKQVACKGESLHASSIILQAKWCVLPQRTLLVITSIKGPQMFEADGSIMVFWQALAPSPIKGMAQYARGITSVGDRYICIGVADGHILVFDVPAKGTAVKLQETLTAHQCSITDLYASKDRMISGDESGKIVTWKDGGHFQKLETIEGFGYPCSSIRIWKTFIVAGYGSGHVRIFNADSGIIIVEIVAHSKWVNAIDIAEENGILMTTSEDSYVRIWNLYNFKLLHQHSAGDIQLTGCKFLDTKGDSYGLTGYDLADVHVYNKS